MLDVGIGSNLYTFLVPKEAEKKYLRSGELAALIGVSRDTLRHYEKKGVLSPPSRSRAGYRLYPATAIKRVQLIRQAIHIGFTLDELAQILRVRDKGGAPCQQVRHLTAEKLAAVEIQLRDLLSMRDVLRNLLANWDERLQQTPAEDRAELLENLIENNLNLKQPSSLLTSHRRRQKKERTMTHELS